MKWQRILLAPTWQVDVAVLTPGMCFLAFLCTPSMRAHFNASAAITLVAETAGRCTQRGSAQATGPVHAGRVPSIWQFASRICWNWGVILNQKLAILCGSSGHRNAPLLFLGLALWKPLSAQSVASHSLQESHHCIILSEHSANASWSPGRPDRPSGRQRSWDHWPIRPG